MFKHSLSIAAICALSCLAAGGDDGVTDKTILVGQAASLKGPAEALGKGMQAGLAAYFNRVNTAGGIHGRTIELNSLNDGYEPEKTAQVTSMLIEKMNVFAMIGAVGTPTSKVAMPLCEQHKVPFIAPFTGAELLRSPFNPWVVNLRASYNQETEALAKHLVDSQGLKKIACMYQNDAYGQAGLAGIKAALERRGIQLVATGTYERNTVAVTDAITTIAAATPDAIVMVGAYKPCAEFIRQARTNASLKTSTLCNISFVGTEALLADLGSASDGVVVSQVVPSPWNTTIPVVKEYHEDMKAAGSTNAIGYVSLEGYLAGKMFCTVLNQIEGTPTREAFLAAVKNTKSLDLGGFTVSFGDQDHQGSDTVYLTWFTGGKVEPIADSNLAIVEVK